MKAVFCFYLLVAYQIISSNQVEEDRRTANQSSANLHTQYAAVSWGDIRRRTFAAVMSHHAPGIDKIGGWLKRSCLSALCMNPYSDRGMNPFACCRQSIYTLQAAWCE